jgi:Protein of unknown function (DUF3574)
MKLLNLYCIISLALMSGVCSTIANEKKMVKTEIYFGLSNKSGPVSDSAWRSFRKNISKNLHGYTEIRADGYWTDLSGNPVIEETAIVIYMHESSAIENAKIDSLIHQYKKIFDQESVLKTDHEIKVSYY